MKQTNGLGSVLKKLEATVSWFDNQENADIEKGLEKVKEGAALLRESRARLAEIENEFEEVRKDLERDSAGGVQ